ncbi:amidohydrolase [Burkholderia multivorans]|jgi:predicted TIM-barrel fold metal-dependent hydrolase|uniref:Amidohydrolase 2 n=2 Tax=Burkholderia multivorans TaxID=87883 RepID=B9BJK5_9BURK|nr:MULTISPECIES: amidohydrolase family protein [Burkholderia]AJY16418.1 amidohydrolase family protein [Burkholderia multivorans ATCC BAA-247]AVR19516.1 amidohydrolase [Burkholderia multivorans]EEE09888.1 amidohydrolase 2 [Burkholderia multivorans CGD2]EEE15810.1 amidohydrolase 2 [Burkholderia multivorans CGD2M]EJO60247.1 amidohydrolase family protein [Burkholderia multivorans ATCC BAA-247]
MTSIVDIHPHIISDDEKRYPPAPLFGKRSEWSQERPNTVEALISAMDEAGVAKAAVVHSSTTYGFDNSYVVDSCARFPDRLVAVGSVDMLGDDVASVIEKWVGSGLAGLRIFTGGSTKDFDPSELENPKSFRAWEILAELKLPMCIQTGPIGLPQVRMLAQKFPRVNIVLDHLARPDVLDGPPYANAASLFAMADLPNVYLKLTPRIFGDVKKEKASAETFFPRVVEAFGAARLAWGSNFPTSPGTLTEILATAQDGLQCLSETDREWIFGKTALKLYPALA